MKTALLPALATLLMAAGCAAPVPVAHEGLDEPRYTRVVFKPDGEKLYSSNFLSQEEGYPLGSEVKVTMYSKQRVELTVNGIPHILEPVEGEFSVRDPEILLTKYFVKERSVLGLEADLTPMGPPAEDFAEDSEGQPIVERENFDLEEMAPAKRSSVERGVATLGMTKEQVFMALGPPVYVNFETSTTGMSIEGVFKTNRWVYFDNAFTLGFFGIFPHAYVFDSEDRLISILR